MSASDMPGNMAAAPTSDDSTQPTGDTNEEKEKGELTQVWKFVYCDLSFVKSLYGIMIAAELVSRYHCARYTSTFDRFSNFSKFRQV